MDIKNPVSLKINVAYQVPQCFREGTLTLYNLKNAFYLIAAIIQKSEKEATSHEQKLRGCGMAQVDKSQNMKEADSAEGGSQLAV